MESIGTCHYCGQTAVITTVGEAPQEQIDKMVTERCTCPEAQAAYRQEQRKKAIDRFVKKHFNETQYKFIHDVIEIVEAQEVADVTLKLIDDRTVKIWLDKDYYLRMLVKHTEEDEIKV